MCTRILNNIDLSQVTVGRNLDWKFMLPAYLYRFVAGRISVLHRLTYSTNLMQFLPEDLAR